MVGTGKDEIQAMFAMNRGDYGYTGYPLWSTVQGDTVTITGLWNNDFGREIGVPLIAHATFTLTRREDRRMGVERLAGKFLAHNEYPGYPRSQPGSHGVHQRGDLESG